MKGDRLARLRAARRFETKPSRWTVFSGLRGLLVLLVGVAVSSCGSSPTSASPILVALTVQPGGNQRVALSSGIGQTIQLNATAAFGGHQANQDVTSTATWQSSNAAVATVSGGLVTAVAPGTVAIAATYQGMTGTVHISVASGSVITAAIDGAAFSGVAVTVQTTPGLQIYALGADALTDPHFSLGFAVQPTIGTGTYDLRSLSESMWVVLFDKTTGFTWSSDATDGGGTLTISTLTSTSASGTFSATLAPGTGTPPGAKVITNGVFNVLF
jgi:hypothetical protein